MTIEVPISHNQKLSYQPDFFLLHEIDVYNTLAGVKLAGKFKRGKKKRRKLHKKALKLQLFGLSTSKLTRGSSCIPELESRHRPYNLRLDDDHQQTPKVKK